jgi:small subunit ribosomal protein S1
LKEDEVLEFEVIEFSKDSKRIIVSHTNIWKGAERAKNDSDDKSRGGDKSRKSTGGKTVKKSSNSSERSTLGELDAFTELRAQFAEAEKGNKKAAKAEADAAAAKVEANEATAVSGGITELKSLAGVGPAMVKRMNALGVNTVEDLTSLSEEKIASMVETDSKISADQWNKWMTEAKA